jgi:hypothetical protein
VKQLTNGSDLLKMKELKLHQFSISENLFQISLPEMGCWFVVMMLKPNKNPHTCVTVPNFIMLIIRKTYIFEFGKISSA